MNYIIKLEEIKKEYNDGWNNVNAIINANLMISHGEMVAIIGKSGCGKTTLLKLIGLLNKNYEGRYYLNNKLVKDMSEKELADLRNKLIGYISQDFCLIEDESVEKNILLPLIYSKNKPSKKFLSQRVDEILTKLHMETKKNTPISKLSGGEKQRIAIARALINNPEIIIADEPTSSVDTQTGLEIMEIFKSIHELGKTVILVTHDEEITRYCDRVIRMKDGILY